MAIQSVQIQMQMALVPKVRVEPCEAIKKAHVFPAWSTSPRPYWALGEIRRTVRMRHTSFALASSLAGTNVHAPIHEVWAALVADEAQSDLIVGDVAACVRDGRSPLVLVDRTAYLDTLESKFAALVPAAA